MMATTDWVPEPIPSERLLVMVDDNEGDRYLAEICLGMSQLQNPLMLLSSGAEFLDYLRRLRSGEGPEPGLVLLDVNMPGMSGLEVLERALDDSGPGTGLRFCILTSSSDPRDREQATALGACGYVRKPGSVDDFVAFFDDLSPR
jgi:two-component system response regulator